MTSEGGAVGVNVSHVFAVELRDDADLHAVVESRRFKASCQSAVASAAGRSKQDVQISSVGVTAGRRLREGPVKSGKVNLKYSIAISNRAEQAEAIATLQDIHFANSFGRHLTAAQHVSDILDLQLLRLSTSFQNVSNQSQILKR